MHAAPSALYAQLPTVEHCMQSSASSFGCCPGEHVEHDCISRVPPISSLCRWVPLTHEIQWVAPTSKEIVSGSSPAPQYWQFNPSDENLPGTQTSHTVCSAFGARPLGHTSQTIPVGETHPLVSLNRSPLVHDTHESAMISRVSVSMFGCVPRPHCSHTPS